MSGWCCRFQNNPALIEAAFPYRCVKLNTQNIYIVEQHHHVLSPWQHELNRRHEEENCYQVISLDHHTDVLGAFSHFFRESPPGAEPEMMDLCHDEHFDFALSTRMVQKVTIFSHADSDCNANQSIRLCCEKRLAPSLPVNAPELIELYDRALESRTLEAFPAVLDRTRPWILDIDLDYFKTVKSLHPEDGAFFRMLASGAAWITLSREADWVRLLSMEGRSFSSDYIEHELIRFFAESN